MIKGVIFDLDGTLLNTLGDLAAAGNAVLAARGLRTYPQEAYKLMVGNGIPRLIRRMLTGTNALCAEEAEKGSAAKLPQGLEPAVLQEFMDYYEAHKEDTTAPYPGIVEMLERLTAAGVKLAVVSNKADQPARELTRRYFGPVFASVVGLKEGGRAKPDPASTLEAVRQLSLPKDEILYVGDSDVDMLTAHNAGLRSCGVLWGFRSADELKRAGACDLVSSAAELERLILK